VGEVYVTGGVGEYEIDLASVEKYSPSSSTWSAVSFMPEPRSAHIAVAIGSAMYVLGGYAGADAERHVTASMLKFDSVQGVWSAVADMPAPSYDFAACVVGSEIYVFGGMSNTGRRQASVLRYDTETDVWSTLTPMLAAERGHSATVLNGLIYVVGAGWSQKGLLCYDPASGVWISLADMEYTNYPGPSFVFGGYLYVAGGEVDGEAWALVQRYDVTTNTWTELEGMLEGRCEFCAVTIGATAPVKDLDLFDSLIAKAVKYDL
jgi:N-acetylneuraminic acid mutarotase